MRRRLFLMALLLFAVGAQRAAAQTCTLTISTLSFGPYISNQLDGTASGQVTCSGGWNIPLNAGTGAGATETIRKMTGPGGATLNYQLFYDSARTLNWGNTTGNELTGTGNTSITVYGRITAGQNPTAGTYTDTVSSATTSFTITAAVHSTCALTAANLDFGTYSGTLLNATSTITVACINKTPYNVGLNAGTATGATVTTRKMTGPSSSLLSYSLFRDSGHTQNWGNTVGTDTLPGTGTGNQQFLTVYGQIPAGQYATPGSYLDTVIVTVTY